MDEARARQLVAFIEARLEASKRSEVGRLRLVGEAGPMEEHDPSESMADRDWLLRRIRFLQSNYSLDFLVDQETYRLHGGIHALPVKKLQRLHLLMEKARELVIDGVNLEDAGLVRTIA